MTTNAGMKLAKAFKRSLLKEHLPVRKVVLFGSFAKGKARRWSDVDIAIICTPFLASRHEENMVFRRLRRDIDARIAPIALHPSDFRDPYFPLAKEIEKHGIEV